MTWKKAAVWAAFFIALAVLGTEGVEEDEAPRGQTEAGEGTGGAAAPGSDRGSSDRNGASLHGEVRGKVQRVIDGDTIKVHLGPRTETVRYIGIDTPETVKPGQPVECFGPQASAFNKRLVDHKPIKLVYDQERRDRYGRLLAYVYVGNRFVNAEMIRRGYATSLRFPPNIEHADDFDRLERVAASNRRGLWKECGVAP